MENVSYVMDEGMYVATREEMKEEAGYRLSLLSLLGAKGFADELKKDIVYKAVYHNSGNEFLPECDYVPLTDEEKKKVREIEEKYGGLVYFVLPHHLLGMECVAFLWVDNDKFIWDAHRNFTMAHIVYAYVWNKKKSEFSEFGGITVNYNNEGVLARTYLGNFLCYEDNK